MSSYVYEIKYKLYGGEIKVFKGKAQNLPHAIGRAFLDSQVDKYKAFMISEIKKDGEVIYPKPIKKVVKVKELKLPKKFRVYLPQATHIYYIENGSYKLTVNNFEGVKYMRTRRISKKEYIKKYKEWLDE